jgi:hypothetical protein
MRPLTSGRSITPWRERKVPTAWVSSVSLITSTRAASTTGTRGVPAPAAAVDDPVGEALPAAVGPGLCTHQATPRAAATPMTTNRGNRVFLVLMNGTQ